LKSYRFSCRFLKAYSKAEVKIHGDESVFVSDNSEQEMHPTYFDLCGLHVSFKHILIWLTRFTGIQNLMRILYNTSPMIETQAFSRVVLITDVLLSSRFSGRRNRSVTSWNLVGGNKCFEDRDVLPHFSPVFNECRLSDL
jgi:hypothetical protein